LNTSSKRSKESCSAASLTISNPQRATAQERDIGRKRGPIPNTGHDSNSLPRVSKPRPDPHTSCTAEGMHLVKNHAASVNRGASDVPSKAGPVG
jgi:hypothetical protein